MEFSYYDSNNQIKKLDIKIGSKWSENKTGNAYINSIFKSADNGDDIVQENEFSIVKFLLKKADSLISKTAGDGVVDDDELWEMTRNFKKEYKMSDLKNGRIDVIDPDDYTLEALKKRYPEDKYDVSVDWRGDIVIRHKGEKQVILRVSLYRDLEVKGKIQIGICSDEFYRSYNEDGTLNYYGILGEKEQYLVPANDDINKLLKSKDSSASERLLDLLQKVNPQNILFLFNQYEKGTGTSLVKAIERNNSLDEATKTKIRQHLTKCLTQTDYWMENRPNTKIDGVLNQGEIGDCFFLASIAAAAVKPKGLQILNNSIKENSDGSYTVKFKGADKEYIVTPLELYDNRDNYSSGDLDVKILEIAANRHFLQGIKYGGNTAKVLDLILGTNDKWKNLGRLYKYHICSKSDEDLRNLIKNPNVIMTTCINIYTRIGFPTRGEEYKDDIRVQHAYAVMDMDDKYVYLKNPHHVDNSVEIHEEKTFKVPIDVFKKHMDLINYVELD